MQLKDQLLSKIENRTACIGVVGLGYVGLPLALEFAKAGFKVIGYDVSERVVKSLMQGKSHIQDVSSTELARLVKSGKFEATTDESRMQEMDAVSIAVPTPLAKTRDPDMGYVIAAADAVGRNCRPGVVVVLESTTYPGTTRELLQPKLEAAGLTVGEDVFLAFSPERVDPGSQTEALKARRHLVPSLTHSSFSHRRQSRQSCAKSRHGVAFLSWNHHPSLPAQGEQRRSFYFNIRRDIPRLGCLQVDGSD